MARGAVAGERVAGRPARLRAVGFAEAVAFEAEHGVITDEEMHDAARRARARAVVVRGDRGAAAAAADAHVDVVPV